MHKEVTFLSKQLSHLLGRKMEMEEKWIWTPGDIYYPHFLGGSVVLASDIGSRQ